MKDLNAPRDIMLRRVQNPSAPSSEEVWQSLQEYRAGIPERLTCWKQAELTSQNPNTQVKQHEPSSCDNNPHLGECPYCDVTAQQIVLYPKLEKGLVMHKERHK